MSQVANTLDRSSIRHFRIPLPAGQDVERAVTGVYFLVAEQEGGDGQKFQVAIDDDPFFPATLGLKFNVQPGNSFSKLRFRNETAAEMTIEIYAGTIEGEDMRLNIVRGRAAPMMNAETVITTHSAAIAATTAVDLTVVSPPGAKYIRKATIITNMDPASDLDIRDASDAVIASVFYRQAFLLESSQAVKVYNPTASPITARIAQVWYVVN